jgi:hypothetical protein
MGEHCLVIAVFFPVLENLHAAWRRGHSRAELIVGVDKLVFEKYKTSLPSNHSALIGVRA